MRTTSKIMVCLLLGSACTANSKDEPDVGIEVDGLATGSADAAGPYQGELEFGVAVSGSLSERNWYHFWSLEVGETSQVFVDLASRDGDDTYLLLYRWQGRAWRNVGANDDCRGSLNSCLETELDAGSYLIAATTYDALRGRPGEATYELTVHCESCAPVCEDGPEVVVRYDLDFCSRARFTCEPGTEYFSDECGCGCRSIEPACEDGPDVVVRHDVAFCIAAFFVCEPGTEYFSDACGCGCRRVEASVPAVQIVDVLPDPGDSVQFERAQLDGNILNLRVRYSGGCAEHDFDLYWDGSVMESLPPQVRLVLTHNANADRCRALPSEDLSFDVSEVVAGDPSVVIHVRGAGDEITVDR